MEERLLELDQQIIYYIHASELINTTSIMPNKPLNDATSDTKKNSYATQRHNTNDEKINK